MKVIRSRGLISLILTAFFALAGNAASAGAANHPSSQSSQPKAADIARDPSDLPPPVGNRPPGVVHVTLQRPDVRNAMNGQMVGELRAVLIAQDSEE